MVEILKVGDSGSQVQALQAELHVRSFYHASIDGHFGPKTRAALLAFQAKAGLDPTGILDDPSRVALGLLPHHAPRPIPLSGPPDVGIWVDRLPAQGEEDTYAHDLASLGLSSASICLWPPSGKGGLWSVGYPPARLHRLTAALRDAGLDVGWCVWGDGRRVKEQMDALRPCFIFPASDPNFGRPAWLELDAEEPWVAHAGETEALAWVDGAAELAGDVRVNFVLPLNKPAPASVRYLLGDSRVSEVGLQAYTAFILGKKWTHADAFRPAGAYLRRCCTASLADLGGHSRLAVRMGLALYGQGHPAPHPKGAAALEASYAFARVNGGWASERGGRFRLWSSKHLNGASRAWIKDITKGGQP